MCLPVIKVQRSGAQTGAPANAWVKRMPSAAIWSSIIFAVVGVFWFFLITNTTFSVMAWIGILILIGIVVNNGIVLLDHVIQLRGRGVDRVDALVQGGRDRLRPILMTTVAMLVAMIPLLTASGPGAVSRFHIGLVITTGLGIGTLFTLFVVPAVYLLLAREHQAAEATSFDGTGEGKGAT